MRVSALVLASGSSIIVAMGGRTEALLLSLGGEGRSVDRLISLFIAVMYYTLAAIAVLSGLAFWLDALLG